MSKRKISDVEEDRDIKIQKLDYEDVQYFYKPVTPLMDIAAFNVAVALWRHQKLGDTYNTSVSRDYRRTHYDANSESFIHLELNKSTYSPGYDYDSYNEYSAYNPTSPGYDPYYTFNRKGDWLKLVGIIVNSVDELPIPAKLRTIITDKVKLLPSFRQFTNWIYYHDHRVFFPEEIYPDLARHQVDEFMFRSDGYIDYLATARNLLLSPRLSEIHKYRIMCTYCMEDELKRVSGLLLNPKYADRVKFEDQPLIYYWNCYLKGELDEINVNGASSLASYMIDKVDNWAAIEYFFDQLDFDEQIVKAVTFIRSQGFKYQSAILAKLSDSQRCRVFVDCASSIITNSIAVASHSEFVLYVWNRCKDLITATQFKDMMLSVCSRLFLSTKDDQHIASLSKEIWTTASPELIDGAVKTVLAVFNSRLKGKYFSSKEVLELFASILKNASANIKTELMLAYRFENNFFLEDIMKTHEPYHVDELLKAFEENSEKIYQRKVKLMNSRVMKSHCVALIQSGDIDKLNDLLTGHLSDKDASVCKSQLLNSQETLDFFIKKLAKYDNEILKKFADDETIRPAGLNVAKYKLKLLQSPTVTDFCVSAACTDEATKLCEFIYDVLLDLKAAGSFMLQICKNEKVITAFRDEINEGRFQQVKEKIELLLIREEDRNVFKLSLITAYEKMLLDGKFAMLNKVQWDEFVPWCSNTVPKFKKSLPVDEILSKMLIRAVTIKFDTKLKNCLFRDQCCFENINNFLHWCFDTEDEIKEFKMNRIMDFKKIEVFDVLMRKPEKYYLRSVMNWFFSKDGVKDQEMIKKFETAHSRHKICNYV